jgi:hypothetical protein
MKTIKLNKSYLVLLLILCPFVKIFSQDDPLDPGLDPGLDPAPINDWIVPMFFVGAFLIFYYLQIRRKLKTDKI